MADYRLNQTGEVIQQRLDQVPVNAEDIQTLGNQKVDKEEGKGLSQNDFTNTLKSKLDNMPANPAPQATTYTKDEVNELIANFITKSVNDLVNYYLKSDTYTKTEVQQLIDAVKQFTYQSVAELPTASADTMNKIYLVPSTNPQTKNVKDEYITISMTDQGTTTYSWEQIGSTEINLSGYYTIAQTDAAINTALASYSTTTQMNAAIATAIANYYTKAEVDALIANFITKAVNDLVNYYLKSDTYSKNEVDQLIATINQFELVSVQSLPTASASTTGKLYFVPSSDPKQQNVKDEYITIATTENNTTTYSWELIGSTQIDLTNYYTKSQTDNAISDALATALASYSTTAQVSTMISTAINSALAAYATKEYVSLQLAGKQASITDGAAIGGGIGVSNTVAAEGHTIATTAAQTAALTGYVLTKNIPVSILFNNAIQVVNSTLNINGQGAKPIYYLGSALQPFVVRPNTIITFVYDGTNYNIVDIEGLEQTAAETDLWVDMGLPSGTLWAKKNIDVTQPDGFAASEYQYECSFFSWGNFDGHNPISESAFDYDFGSSNAGPYASTPGAALNGNIPASMDCARANLGAPWRLPTTDELAELFNPAYTKYIDANGDDIPAETTNKLVTMNGIVGVRLKSKVNNNILFFPCSGYVSNGTAWGHRGTSGRYWSSSLNSDTDGYCLICSSNNVNPNINQNRYRGSTIRPVL